MTAVSWTYVAEKEKKKQLLIKMFFNCLLLHFMSHLALLKSRLY